MRLITGHLSIVVTAIAIAAGAVRGAGASAERGRAADTRVAARPNPDDSVAVLARVGEYVQRYYARAQHLVSLERVTLQPLAHDLSADGRAWRLEYELRVEWTPSGDGKATTAKVLRQLLTVDGRKPRSKDEPGCMDPKSVSPEPLEMFLPRQQGEYAFRWAGAGRTDRRAAAMLDYRSVRQGPMQVAWHGDCVTVELPGRATGRVWADAGTGEVLRVEEHLRGLFDIPVPAAQQKRGGSSSMTIERSDTSIQYKPVTFREPDETLMMPASIQTLTIIRDAGVPRLRVTQVFSNYRRFVTDARVVDEP